MYAPSLPPGRPPAGAWSVVATAVRGKGHEKTGQPCQDAVAFRLETGGVLLAAVADGAGSAKLGEVGSEIAARTALDFLAGAFPPPNGPADDAGAKGLLRSALEAALKAVSAEAAARQVRPGDLATTLLLCVASPDRLLGAQVGDGAVVFAGADGALKTLTRPAAGEYLNETVFLTSADALGRAQFEVWTGRSNQLALFSDGLQMLALKMPDAQPHAPFFQPLFAWFARNPDPGHARADLERLLRSPRVSDRTDDDLTLLLARRQD